MVLSFSDSWELQSVHYVIRIKLCRDSDPSLVTIFRIRIHNSDEITWELRSILYVIRIKLCQDSDPSLIRIFRIRIHNTINPMTTYRLRTFNTNQAWAHQGAKQDPDPYPATIFRVRIPDSINPMTTYRLRIPNTNQITWGHQGASIGSNSSFNNFSDPDPQH